MPRTTREMANEDQSSPPAPPCVWCGEAVDEPMLCQRCVGSGIDSERARRFAAYFEKWGDRAKAEHAHSVADLLERHEQLLAGRKGAGGKPDA